MAQQLRDLLYNFNSCMVRLKVFVGSTNIHGFLKFQFLYGTIKGESIYGIAGTLKIFQFLYGTIKGRIEPSGSMSLTPFQFLYGTIKGYQGFYDHIRCK